MKKTEELFEDEVSTGAELSTGTTVSGNKAYHLGNDGQGSGLDVDTVDGTLPVISGGNFKREFSSGSVILKEL